MIAVVLIRKMCEREGNSGERCRRSAPRREISWICGLLKHAAQSLAIHLSYMLFFVIT